MMYKIVTFCPEADIDKIINAMSDAGAGVVGKYTHCAYITEGKGNWFSGEGTNPTNGKVGMMSREVEYRVEISCLEKYLNNAIIALKKAHSYEEPEINVYSLIEINN